MAIASNPGTKSARRANHCISPGGSRSRAVLPRANAWCRICPRRGRRSRSTIPIRCRRSCGWRFRAMPGPGAAAKWSGAAANRSASSSSASLASIGARAIKGGMRKSLLVMIAAAAACGCRGRRAAPSPEARQGRNIGQAAAAEALAIPANACAEYGAGFVRIEGTNTCVKIGGAVSIGAGVSSGSALKLMSSAAR